MRRWLWVALALGATGSAWALAPPSRLMPPHRETRFSPLFPILRVDNSLTVGYQLKDFSYTEPSDNCALGVCTNAPASAYLDREAGDIPGARIGLAHLNVANGWYERLVYERAWGTVHYQGYTDTGAPISDGVSYADISGYSLRLGAGFPRADMLVLPFLQIGRHVWQRTLAAGSTQAFEEQYSHEYVALGALLQVVLTAHVVGSLYADAGEVLAAHIDVPSKKFSAALGGEPLIKAGVLLDVLLPDRIGLFGGVRYTRFGYGQSVTKVVGNYEIMEPQSNTTLASFEGGLRYAFF